MFFIETNISSPVRQASLETIFYFFVFFTVGFLLVCGYFYEFAFLVLLASCVFVAFRFHLFTVLLLLIFAVLPKIFFMVPEYSEKWMSIGFGIRIEDVVLVSMLGAALLKAILSNRKQLLKNNGVSVYKY